MNTKITSDNNAYSEIKSVLGQQLLQSKNFKPAEDISSEAYRNNNVNIPQYVENLLIEVDKKWRLSGSRNRTGIIGLATINNHCELINEPIMKTMLENYCANKNFKYKPYEFEELNKSITDKKLKITDANLPRGSFNLVIILDPLIDLGGVQSER